MKAEEINKGIHEEKHTLTEKEMMVYSSFMVVGILILFLALGIRSTLFALLGLVVMSIGLVLLFVADSKHERNNDYTITLTKIESVKECPILVRVVKTCMAFALAALPFPILAAFFQKGIFVVAAFVTSVLIAALEAISGLTDCGYDYVGGDSINCTKKEYDEMVAKGMTIDEMIASKTLKEPVGKEPVKKPTAPKDGVEQ